MKKIWILLLMVSVVAGMTMPAMADTSASAGSSSNGGANTLSIDNAQTASNYAAHSVSATLNAAPQTNNIHDVLVATGDNTNGALASFAATAKTGATTSGDANSGGAGTGDANAGTATSGGIGVSDVEAEVKGCCGEDDDGAGSVKAKVDADTGDAKSKAESGDSTTGDATSGKAKSEAEVENNDNKAKANGNTLISGNADNNVHQMNIQKQITPVTIYNDQKVKQKIIVKDIDQKANSEPVTIAKAKSKAKKTDIDLGAGDDIKIILPFLPFGN